MTNDKGVHESFSVQSNSTGNGTLQTNTHVIDPGTMSKKDYREGHGCCNVSFAFSSVDLHISEGKAHFVLQVVSRKVKLLVQLIFMLQEMSRN